MNNVEYTLETPITFGGQTIEKVTVNKPNVVALSGVSLQDLYRSDVNALCSVIPKCTTPMIPREAMTLMDPVDLTQIAGHIILFLIPKSQRQALDMSV